MSDDPPDPPGFKPEGPPRIAGQKAVRPKSAATVMIIRRDGPKPRVLMGRRHGGHSFMPDRWVFPGGRIERADYRAPFASDLKPGEQAVFDAHLRPGQGRALALAAIRETWEEAGLLLARKAPTRPGVGPWRPFLAQGRPPRPRRPAGGRPGGDPADGRQALRRLVPAGRRRAADQPGAPARLRRAGRDRLAGARGDQGHAAAVRHAAHAARGARAHRRPDTAEALSALPAGGPWPRFTCSG
ncbi:NUDIX hydrolase [Phenylobacterium sp. J367]|uniref:NUDIX hydrolase n=1 Tax=Phenylobacterium sp. J367 TaxID=2898435 RepID=UPI00215100B2|nr:NUDIX hydrolase [Phenylobacterium sp. J367]MCR5880697.1 NUDIX hydrolase [Phenylobacterium sp. J367]